MDDFIERMIPFVCRLWQTEELYHFQIGLVKFDIVCSNKYFAEIYIEDHRGDILQSYEASIEVHDTVGIPNDNKSFEVTDFHKIQ